MTNKEVYDLYKDPTIVADIKKGRLCLTGRATWKECPTPGSESRIRTLEEKRPKGRPRLRWLDDVERDLRLMGSSLGRKKQDMSQWKEVVRQARALDGL